MDKLLVICTGGTIAMVDKGSGLGVDPDFKNTLVDYLLKLRKIFF